MLLTVSKRLEFSASRRLFIKRWSDEVEARRPYDDPERRDWFVEQTKPLGLDPSKISLFDWLEADDKASHAKAA